MAGTIHPDAMGTLNIVSNARNRILLAVGCVIFAVIKSACGHTAKKLMKDTAAVVNNIKYQLELVRRNQEIVVEAVKDINTKLFEQGEKNKIFCTSLSCINDIKSDVLDEKKELKAIQSKISSIVDKMRETEKIIYKLSKDADKLPDVTKSVVKEYFVSLHNEHEQIYSALQKSK